MQKNIIRFPHERTHRAVIDRSIDYLEQLHEFAMANREQRRELFKPIPLHSGGRRVGNP